MALLKCDYILPLFQTNHIFFGPFFQDSVELKNICLRMAIAEGYCSNRDLRELRDCLRHIVGNLLACVRDENNLSSAVTTRRLRELSNSFPDI